MSTRHIARSLPRPIAAAALAALTLAGAAAAASPSADPYAHWPAAQRQAQREFEAALVAVPTAESLRRHHDLFCAEPHPAGTEADARMIDTLADAFENLGLDEVVVEEFHPYLAFPVSASVQVVTSPRPEDSATLPLNLPLKERPVEGDPYSSDPALGIGWNAYSGNGDVTAEIIYANYATKEDFEQLAEWGVDVTGRIVIARYGRIFRGLKATFAERAGAAGLILYTDPADSGYARGLPWPEGGYANDSSIQRGSVKALAYPGDPLTPEHFAGTEAPRRAEQNLELPTIPVQPIGWGAAEDILSRMGGRAIPHQHHAKWQGGLPFAYRLTGGPGLTVRVAVEQERRLARTANVIGMVRGETFPEEMVILGCHFDAWTFGAGDPHAGSIVLYEIARSFAELARQGRRPARTIVFANWAAEEHGIIGSTEWVERHETDLVLHTLAYINLDMAAMGPNFRAAAAPALRQVIADAADAVPHPDHSGQSVWSHGRTRRAGAEPRIGLLAGGSDHVAFYSRVGIPSCSLGAGGAPGVSYHTGYDDLAWYRAVVGEDYHPALMLSQVGAVLTARLANAAIVPLDPVAHATATLEQLDAVEQRATAAGLQIDTAELRAAIATYAAKAQRIEGQALAQLAGGEMEPEALHNLNVFLRTLEFKWLGGGLPRRPWYRHTLVAPHPDTGYSAWALPALADPVDAGEPQRAAAALKGYQDLFEQSLMRILQRMDGQLERSAASATPEQTGDASSGRQPQPAGDRGIVPADR